MWTKFQNNAYVNKNNKHLYDNDVCNPLLLLYKMSRNLYRKRTKENVFLFLLFMSLVILISFALLLSSRQLVQPPEAEMAPVQSKSSTKYSGFLVDTKNCKIPNLDPFEPSVRNYFRFNGPLSCPDVPVLTYQEDDMLRINQSAIKHFKLNDFKNCQYQPIIRPNNSSDFVFEYIQDGIWFAKDIKVKHEFMRVLCYSESGGLMYTNFHSFVLPDKNLVKARLNSLQNAPYVKERMNVLLIGVDSISRLNFIRQMPRTRKYLLNHLNAYEMNGYNKVADNTFVNIVPLAAGKYVKELPWNENLANEPFDKYNFIWKNYSDNGYMTLYAEDAPSISIFNFLKAGFHKPPCDHYNRPFFLAMVRNRALWKGKNCILNRLETDFILRYVYDFTKVYHDKPHLAFAFITRLTHDGINTVGYADEPYYNFFNKMEREGRLNNTVVFFYSDHGSRFGDFRTTYLGKLEERLPFMFLIFPKWFIKRYPDIDQVLKINSHRLTTPFDIHKTLVDILNFDGKVRKATVKKRGISLFSEVPGDRSCQDASILPHWCTCMQHIPVNISDMIVEKIALSLVNRINKMTHKVRQKCAFLQLKTIKDATKMIAAEKILRFWKSVNDVNHKQVYYNVDRVDAIVDYQLTLETTPGGAQFEITARYDEKEGTFELMNEVSRVNSYGNQSSCIDILALKMYCFCGG